MITRRVSLALAAVLLAAPVVVVAHDSEHEHEYDHGQAPAQLVRLVRDATQQFLDVNAATALGYGPSIVCVSGPDHCAMGVHYLNITKYSDGLLDASAPQALIYEPSGSRLRLVGVEF